MASITKTFIHSYGKWKNLQNKITFQLVSWDGFQYHVDVASSTSFIRNWGRFSFPHCLTWTARWTEGKELLAFAGALCHVTRNALLWMRSWADVNQARSIENAPSDCNIKSLPLWGFLLQFLLELTWCHGLEGQDLVKTIYYKHFCLCPSILPITEHHEELGLAAAPWLDFITDLTLWTAALAVYLVLE